MSAARSLAALVLALVVAPGGARADDYLVVFAAEAVPYRPGKAHTFATVVRVETGPDGVARVADLRSLSWLPAAGTVRPLAVRPETGRNVPLDETLRNAVAAGERVTVWGPYHIAPEFADAFRTRVSTVEASFGYKGASFLSPLSVCDCVRSVEEMVDPHRRYIGVFGYGTAAASVVVQKFSPWMIDPHQTHPWVGTLIGLDAYPTVARSFGDYTTKSDQMRAFRRR